MTEKEFAEIVSRTKRIVLSAIEKNLAPRFYHAIDDAAQETYLRAYRALEKNSFRGNSKIETWLYKIAKNESLRINQKLMREEEKIKKATENIVILQHDLTEEAGPSVQENLLSVPGKYRSVLELVLQGLHINDISRKLGIKPGTVKSRASRGRKIILENLRREKNETE